jgi:polyhydroxyalkanoate synthesis regulator phasin
MNIKSMVDRMIEDGKLTQEEHLRFLYAVQEDGKIDIEEREQINRILDLIKSGKIIVV